MAREPAPANIGGGAAQVMRLQDMARLGELRGIDVATARRQEEEARRQAKNVATLRDMTAFTDTGDIDRDGTLSNLVGAGHKALAAQAQSHWTAGDSAAQTAELEREKMALDNHAKALANQKDTMKRLAVLLDDVRDQRSWASALKTAVDNQWMKPEEAESLSTYDVNAWEYLNGVKKQLREADSLVLTAEDELKKKQDKINAALELYGRLAPVISDQKTLDTAHELTGGVMRPLIGGEYHEGMGTTLAELAKTPAERAAAEERAAKRQQMEEAVAQKDSEKTEAEAAKEQEKRAKAAVAIDAELRTLDKALEAPTQKVRSLTAILDAGTRFDRRANKQVELAPQERTQYQIDLQSAIDTVNRIGGEQARLREERATLVQHATHRRDSNSASGKVRPVATRGRKPRQVDPRTGRTIHEQKFSADALRRRAAELGIDPEAALAKARESGVIQ